MGEVNYMGLLMGGLFGAALYLAGLANPDKIIGTLRLKDFHAFKVIVVFLVVGMFGVWMLTLGGEGNISIKPAVIIATVIGGVLLGIGFGLSGFCPGTGLACAAAGWIDALVAVVGMFVGAMVYILLAPYITEPMASRWDYGTVTLPEITNTSTWVWVVGITVLAAALLAGTSAMGRRGRRREAERDYAVAAPAPGVGPMAAEEAPRRERPMEGPGPEEERERREEGDDYGPSI